MMGLKGKVGLRAVPPGPVIDFRSLLLFDCWTAANYTSSSKAAFPDTHLDQWKYDSVAFANES